MASTEDIQRLESELEQEKRDLRNDVAQMDVKIQTVREELSPTFLIHKAALPLCAAALVGGFIIGYFGIPFEVRDAAKEGAKSAVKAVPPVLAASGARAAMRRLVA